MHRICFAGDMHSKIFDDRVHELKETQKAKETTIALAKMGLSADKIAKAVKIGVDIVQKWIDKSMSVAHYEMKRLSNSCGIFCSCFFQLSIGILILWLG